MQGLTQPFQAPVQAESSITGMSNAAGSGKDDGTNAWHSRDGIIDKVKIKKLH